MTEELNLSSLDNILIITAMDIEKKAALSHLRIDEKIILSEWLGLNAISSKVGKKTIFLIESGVGIANGAVATAYAIDHLHPSAIIVLGVAGSLRDFLGIGEVIISNSILQHDAVYSGENFSEFMAPGELHLSVDPKNRVNPFIETSAPFSQWISEVLEKKNIKTHTGVILSGSEFVGNYHRKLELAKLDSKAMAVEMESVGIGQIARKKNIPFIVIKTIADRLLPSGSIASDYLKFSQSAAETASSVIEAIIHEWSK